MEGSFCSVCGEALISPLFEGREDALCGACQAEHPPFDRALAYGSYDGGLRDLVHLLKYQQVRPAAKVLGQMLAEAMARLEAKLPAGPVLVVPVPLHLRKKNERGFNQSEQIAAAALKQLAMPQRFELRPGILVRQRETASQIGLTRAQRRENIRGAFAVVDKNRIAGHNIILVDDVYTTGTTASECARVLRRAGASGVRVATVARTLKINEAITLPENLQEGVTEDRPLVAAHS